MRTLFVGCLLLVSLFGLPGSLHAEPPVRSGSAEARKLTEEGNKLYNVRAFAEAAAKYKAAALVGPVPMLDYSLGQCYRQLGKYEDAIWHYRRYLETGKPQPEKRAAVEQFIEQMRAELDRKAMSQPPTTVDEGADAPQVKPARVEQASAAPTSLARTSAVGDRASDGGRTGWFWLGVGLTSAGIVGSGGTAWLAVTADRMESQSKQTGRTTSERLDLADRADSRRSNALVVGIASGITLGLGVVTLAVAPRVSRRSNGVAFTLGFTGNGLAMVGRF